MASVNFFTPDEQIWKILMFGMGFISAGRSQGDD